MQRLGAVRKFHARGHQYHILARSGHGQFIIAVVGVGTSPPNSANVLDGWLASQTRHVVHVNCVALKRDFHRYVGGECNDRPARSGNPEIKWVPTIRRRLSAGSSRHVKIGWLRLNRREFWSRNSPSSIAIITSGKRQGAISSRTISPTPEPATTLWQPS